MARDLSVLVRGVLTLHTERSSQQLAKCSMQNTPFKNIAATATVSEWLKSVVLGSSP